MAVVTSDRYKPDIALGELRPEERGQLCAAVGLDWDEIRAVLHTPTQELLDHLTAQARIVQAIGVIACQRQLTVSEAELADLRRHHKPELQGQVSDEQT